MNQLLPPDFSIIYDQQEYRPVSARPHITMEGRHTVLVTWETNCPRCERQFLVTTGPKFTGPRRFCDDCKGAGRTVKNMRKALRRDLCGALQ